MSKCPHCGAEVQYSPKDHLVVCDYCGSKIKVSELLKEYKKAKKVKKEEDNSPKFQGMAYNCSQCGATLLSFDETTVTFCCYCGSQNVLEDKLIEQTAPDFIIPFSKTKEECIENYKKIIRLSLFCPNYMKSDIVLKKFRGIYMPYGIYNLGFSGECVNHGEKYSHRSGNYDYYDKYDLKANVQSTYNGISYDLLSKFYDDYSQAIPFNYKGAVPFNPNYLPGFYADCKDVDSSVYLNDALKIAETDSVRFLKKDSTFSHYNCYSPKVLYGVEEKKTGLFPVYFASIVDRDQKHIHYAIINGQTGMVAADIPVDFKKYILFSFVFAIPIFFLMNSYFTISPTTINFLTIFIAIIGMIIFFFQYNSCIERESHINDKGYSSLLSNSQKKEIQKKIGKSNFKSIKSLGCLTLFIQFLISILLFCAAIFLSIEYPDYSYQFIFIAILLAILVIFAPSFISKLKNKKKKSTNSSEHPSRSFYLIKIIPAIIIPIVVLLINPISDLYYYGSGIISLSLVLLSFSDLINIHNQLSARPIPQLEKRGGDTSE